MSWAALAHKAKDVAQSSTGPKRIVTAPADGADAGGARILHAVTGDDGCPALPAFRQGLLVLDANAFIKRMDELSGMADALVTTAQVVAEVRDRAAKDALQRMSCVLHVLEPSRASVAAVMAVATKTGDLGAMGRTDMRLCALALDCCRAAGALLEPIEPRPAAINPDGDTKIITDVQDEDYDEEEEERGGGDDEEAPHPQRQSTDPLVAHNDNNGNNNDDDDEGWITPENIHQFTGGEKVSPGERFDGGVACVTSDYAMQNTLLHLGVPIVGPRGMRIRELRHWLLRCTSCFATTTDTTRQFCATCGSGNTLRRVQYVVTCSGERRLFINFRKTLSTRGTVYNLPKPRGGRRGTNRTLLLREDQLAHVIRGTTSAKMKERVVARGDAEDDLAAFGVAPRRQKRDPAQLRITSSYHKYNVNEMKKVRAARRK